MDYKSILFSQSDIANFAKIARITVSRQLSQKKVVSVVNGDEKRKKYSFETARDIIRENITKKLKPKDKVQVFFNFKGGTGKTSICHQISVMFALYGFKVLAIDCDPQAHLSYSLGFNEDQEYYTLYDSIVNKLPIEDIIKKGVYPGLDIIPANLSLTRLELPLNQQMNREKVLSKLIEKIKNKYDFIFIDTNPTISTLNRNATLAADVLNIVCETQPYSLKGLEILVNEITNLAEAMESEIKYQIIPNKYEAKTVTSQESLGILHTKYKEHMLASVIRKCEDINISAKMRKPVFAIGAKKSVALEDIKDLTEELINKSCIKSKGELFDAA